MPGPIVRVVLERLKKVRRSGTGWVALCPAHEDRDPSLSVTEGADGRVLVNCHTGCHFEEIASAIGLAVADFFPPKDPTYTPPRPIATARRPSPNGAQQAPRDVETEDQPDEKRTWPVVAEYDYRDARGSLVFQVVRKEPPMQLDGAKRQKTFLQRKPAVGGDWVYGSVPIDTRPLYRLPDLLEDLAAERTIVLVEGEKDVETARSLGLAATTHAGGANGWRDLYAGFLRGANVVVIPDNDEPGRQWAQKVGTALGGVAASVRIVALPIRDDGADLTDWVQAGGTARQFERLVNRVPLWTSGQAVPTPPAPSRFRIFTDVDLEALQPLRCVVDGVFPESSLLCVFGAPGSGKSFLTLDLACSLAIGRPWLGRTVTKGSVLYVAAEGGRGYRKRMLAWKDAMGIFGISVPVFFVLEPANLYLAEDIGHILRATDTLPSDPALVVFDTLHRSMTGGDENSAQDIGLVMDRADRIKRELSTAVLFNHHTRKDDNQERGTSSIRGSVDTLAMVREEEDGSRALVCEKQKDFDEFPPLKFDLVPRGESCVVQAFDPARMSGRLTSKQRDALRSLLLFGAKGATSAEWLKAASLAERTFYHARAALVHQGLVAETEKGNSTRFTLSDSGKWAANERT